MLRMSVLRCEPRDDMMMDSSGLHARLVAKSPLSSSAATRRASMSGPRSSRPAHAPPWVGGRVRLHVEWHLIGIAGEHATAPLTTGCGEGQSVCLDDTYTALSPVLTSRYWQSFIWKMKIPRSSPTAWAIRYNQIQSDTTRYNQIRSDTIRYDQIQTDTNPR